MREVFQSDSHVPRSNTHQIVAESEGQDAMRVDDRRAICKWWNLHTDAVSLPMGLRFATAQEPFAIGSPLL